MADIKNYPKGREVALHDMLYVNDPGIYDPITSLFDKNDDYVQRNTGVILTYTGSCTSIKFTVRSPIILYAISIPYYDSGGYSGGDISIYKLEESSYIFKEKVHTKGEKTGFYKLCELKPGSYWFKAETRYVTFTEWYAVHDNSFFINVKGVKYTFNEDGTFKKVLDSELPDKVSGCELELIFKNKNNILEISDANKFKIEILK